MPSKSLRTLLVLALAALTTSHPQPQIETVTLVASSDRPWFQTPSLPTSTVVTSEDNVLGNHPHSATVAPEPLPPSHGTSASVVTYTDLAHNTIVTATVITTAPVPTYSVGVPPPMSDLLSVTHGAPAATVSSDGFVQITAYTGSAPSLLLDRNGMWCFIGSAVGLAAGFELL
ncbi:hypothetical protein H2200_004964 [Cladophialophora chaetospira]|uniref:Uncharacterized protein n=1 Tax=Cladophialophora chaetospira TaxID=386627 RepID=A0AA39CJ53_9EURO|nr:hypothetical protein H2200_004964 [Cladophialophora chaetospira]